MKDAVQDDIESSTCGEDYDRTAFVMAALLLVLVLLLVVRISVCCLLHDRKRPTSGRTSDHLLLDSCRDGSGLLLLSLGCLYCRLLLRRNYSGYDENRKENSSLAYLIAWGRKRQGRGSSLQVTYDRA